jgi:predicted  nucleic acid-binding Zn-ribbon protein
VLKEQITNEQSPADQAKKDLESARDEIVKLKSKVEGAEKQVKLFKEIADKEANWRKAD